MDGSSDLYGVTNPGDENEDDDNEFPTVNSQDPNENDLYTFLNVSKSATMEEITNQYRKLSRIYHPDKCRDPEKQIYARQLFERAKTAHEILTDPHRRAIYDTLGMKGIKDEKELAIVTRFRSPQEIREDYERLQREKEERRLERLMNPKGSVTVNINVSELFSPYDASEEDEDLMYYDAPPYLELTGFHFAQSIEAPFTSRDTCTMSGNVSAENGRGKGQIMCGLRRIIGQNSWGEFEVGGNTNGMDFGLKGSAPVFNTGVASSFSIMGHSTEHGFRPFFSAGLHKPLDQMSTLNLLWRAGSMNGLQTSYMRGGQNYRFVASLYLGIPHSFASSSVYYKLENNIKLRGAIKAGTFGAMVEYGVDKKYSQVTSLSATMVVGVPVGVMLRLRLTRGNQTYIFPIQLSDQILPPPIFYGTVAPVILWTLISKLFLEPYEEEKKRLEKEKQKAAYKEQVAEKKAEASAAIALMRETYHKIVSDERTRSGLVIMSATYGAIFSGTTSAQTGSSDQEVLDVTIPVQCLVRDSRLDLHDSTKVNLPGFYDPAPGEEKSLLIRYLFQNREHQVIVQDTEAIQLPKTTHQVAPI
ncbi:unnamed protein product [Orchesella dallaii]|uniref:J domain-containing protein n=1 Tax=Orchesella dallaii TaxID=48710 RepID=A0ABP1QCC2_9HEXA